MEMNNSEAGKFRTILPQVLASSAKNLLLVQLGLATAFATIVIPALRGTIERDPDETLSFTDIQASWYGSVVYICQPIGASISGWFLDRVGRKKAMICVNIPFISAWIILHNAKSIEMMYIGDVLLGLGVGLSEAPILTYIGEICQPSIRGILIACTSVFGTIGSLTVFSLGVFTSWRKAALICLCIPMLAILAIFFVPETPMWLLSKNRNKEALRSLQWLRGWVSPKAVEKEFNEMMHCIQDSKKCTECKNSGSASCNHPLLSTKSKVKELFRKRTVKPFTIILGLFIICYFNGAFSMRPFLVQIFKAYNIPLNPSVATAYLGAIGLLGNIVCMSTIKFLGKRKLCMIGLIGALICCVCLAIFGQIHFPDNYNSFDRYENIQFASSFFPLIVIYMLYFCTMGGVASIPWFLLSELFVFKTRGLATGLCAAIGYSFGFVSTKIYIDLDKGLNLNGVMWFYMVFNFIGLIFVYFIVPETENHTLEEIEAHFSNNSKTIWDIKIKNNNDLNNKKELNYGYDNKTFAA